MTRLLLPFEPDDLLADLAAGTRAREESLIDKIHVFPLGGIMATCDYLARLTLPEDRAETSKKDVLR